MPNGTTATAAAVTITTTTATPFLVMPSPALQESTTKLALASIPTPNNGPQVSIIAYANITWGTNTIGATLTCSDETGFQLSPTITLTAAAGQTSQVIAGFVDNRGNQTRHNYTVSVQQTAATGNGQVNFAAGFCQTPG